MGKENARFKVEQSKRMGGCLISVWWDKQVRQDTKKRIGQSMGKSVLACGCEVCSLGSKRKEKRECGEIDYLRCSAGKWRLQRIQNEEIRRIMDAEQSNPF